MATTAPPKPAADSAPNAGWKPELREIPTDRITVGGNVRADVGDVDELAASIKAHGVLSPISVQEVGVAADGGPRYVLVYGQRRLAATRAAGIKTIPAIVSTAALSDRDRTVAQLIENLQRADLNALDTAKAYRALLDAGLTQRELGEQLGIAQPTIANTLALLKAPAAIQERVAAGELTRSHVEAIAKLPAAEQTEVARRIVEHGLSVDDVRNEIELAARRAVDEQSREERRKNEAASRLANVIELLAKKKIDQAKVTLVGYLGTASDVFEQLKPLGWKVQTQGNYPAPAKGICDCSALKLSFNYEWPGGKQVEKISLTKACMSSKHQKAAARAEREAWETQERERKEAAAKAAEERDAQLAPIAAAVVTPIPPAKAKLLLYAMVDVGHNGYWQAGELADRLGVKLSYEGWREQLWEAIGDLDHGRLLDEIAHRVAECVTGVDAKHPMRTVVAGLIESKLAEPQPDRPPKPPKPPKDREQA